MALIHGPVFVVGDNIDTDQIIPAKHLTLVPTIPEEYRELGKYALIGLPDSYPPFVEQGAAHGGWPIIIAGQNFGCGSSREHAPIALGAAGVKAVVAQSFARIFFRNSIATGEIYPIDSRARLCDLFQTGDQAEIDLDRYTIRKLQTDELFELIPLGDAKQVIDSGGIFDYARKAGMIS